ncbi:response regulator transcription factor [Streptomyces sp. NPDC005574]|uniref:response regulator transcription factor n=1 Tax=Streptomyces sp. NPDC005574 TaxID=3156891 RepID=UPI0033A78AE7
MRTPAAPHSTPFRILVVEDDATMGQYLDAGLRGNGYASTWSRTGTSARAEADRTSYDVLLLDLSLPDMDGLDVTRTLRARHPNLLMVVLTAHMGDTDVISGLDAGADDYLIKPFGLTALLARLRARLRLYPVAFPPCESVRLGDLVIDAAARRCTLHERKVNLRPKEFGLLVVLARHTGAAVPRETLMEEVWNKNWSGSTKCWTSPWPDCAAASSTRPERPRLEPAAAHHHAARTRLSPGTGVGRTRLQGAAGLPPLVSSRATAGPRATLGAIPPAGEGRLGSVADNFLRRPFDRPGDSGSEGSPDLFLFRFPLLFRGAFQSWQSPCGGQQTGYFSSSASRCLPASIRWPWSVLQRGSPPRSGSGAEDSPRGSLPNPARDG